MPKARAADETVFHVAYGVRSMYGEFPWDLLQGRVAKCYMSNLQKRQPGSIIPKSPVMIVMVAEAAAPKSPRTKAI